nr:MAG TPA: hypothetical protein [Caudoviricetes sp.]
MICTNHNAFFSMYPPWIPTATYSRGMLSQPGKILCDLEQFLCFSF